MKAKVISANISESKGTQKKAVQMIELVKEHGVKGDAHAGEGIRQVSLLSIESIEKMKRQGLDHLVPGDFGENITTSGIILHDLEIGTILKIGETLHEVTKIGKECHTRCAIYHQAGDCIMPKEGIFTKVLKGGIVKAGDEIVSD
jgi:MOSC domain-containing protein YiiM